MIAEKFVDLYARNSGVRDKIVAERDVVLTYALRAMHDAGLLKHLAFKGGTALRKLVFGSTGRFSEDLDFTFASARKPDDVFVELIDLFSQTHHGIRYAVDEDYETIQGTSLGVNVTYRHDWNESSFHLQISLREEPTLPVAGLAMKEQSYFKQLEFDRFEIPGLPPIEMASEKVRAAAQRVKVRDLYDLHLFAKTPFKAELLRALVVLKLWQSKGPFDPDAFFNKIDGGAYEWDDLRRLVRTGDRLEAAAIKREIRSRYAKLSDLTELEAQVVAGAKAGKARRAVDALRVEANRMYAAG